MVHISVAGADSKQPAQPPIMGIMLCLPPALCSEGEANESGGVKASGGSRSCQYSAVRASRPCTTEEFNGDYQ